MSTEEVKLCKNCKHMSKMTSTAMCLRPVKMFSYVYGQHEINLSRPCELERIPDGSCGHDARYFEGTTK